MTPDRRFARRSPLIKTSPGAAALIIAVTGRAGTAEGQAQVGDTRFVAGDGKITLFAVADREQAPAVAGQGPQGGTV